MIINKYIIHVLDKNNDGPILNDFEGGINPEFEGFFQKTIKKILRDDNLRKATFNDYRENVIRICCENIIQNEKSFVENSKEIAAFLFNAIKCNGEMDSCDLAICLYTEKDEQNIAIIKLDYKKLYTHSIEYINDKFNIQMITNDIGLQESQRQTNGAIVGVTGLNDEYNLLLLDKEAEKKEETSRFVTDFLNAEKISDDKYKTKVFKNTTENWITNAYRDDIKGAEDLRSVLNYSLKENNDMEVDRFIQESITKEELRESYKELLESKDIKEDFEIDKTWIEKKLKRRSIKTDTGFDVKGKMEDFEDPMKYSIKKNEDGSIDITIKNICFYEEK